MSQDIERLHPGPRMSGAVVHNDVIYLSGQVGSGADVTAQCHDALSKVEQLLTEAGSSKSRMLSATIWLADMADFAAMNAVWEGWIDPANPPARATGESKLANPDLKVEFMIIAAR